MVRINLAPGERPGRARRPGLPTLRVPSAESPLRSPSTVMALLGLVALLAVVFLYFGERRAVAGVEAAIAGAEADSAELHDAVVRVRQMETAQRHLVQRVEMLESVIEGRLYWVALMEALSRTLPPYTWLEVVDREELGPEEIRIAGATFANAAVTDYMRGLEGSAELQDVTLVGVSRVQQDSIAYQGFTLIADFEGYEAAVIAPPQTEGQEETQ